MVAADRRVVAAGRTSAELPGALSPVGVRGPGGHRPGRPSPGPTGPQAGIPLPPVGDRLLRAALPDTASLCWLGTHGGSGAGTLASLVPGTAALRGAWPVPPQGSGTCIPVVLVARSHAEGLRTAQSAMTEWAAGLVGGVQLLGLAVVADAPGRLPRPLRQLTRLVGGGVPSCWELPWVEEWRRGAPPILEDAPSTYRRFVAGLLARPQEPASPSAGCSDVERPRVGAAR